LGANYILQGTVRWENLDGETHVRVNPTLIKVEDGTQAWSQSMESVLSSAFKLQSDIASRVAGAMDVALAKTEKKSLETSLTENSEAYDYYLQAIEYSERSLSKSDLEIATKLFDRAIRIDPSFAAAYAKLSYVHSNIYWFFYDHTESRIDKSRLAAEKAVEISPQLSEAHEAMGWYFYHAKLDYKSALEEFSLALKYRPSNSNVHYGIAAVMRRQGNMVGAVESFKKSIAGSPRASNIIRDLGETQTLLRDYAEANLNYDKALERSPDVVAIYWEKTKNILLWKGDISEARRVVEECRRLGKDNGTEYFLGVMSFDIEILDGNFQGAKVALDRENVEEILDNQFEFVPSSLLRAHLETVRGNETMAKKYYDSARVFLERKQKTNPDDERLYSTLGIAYAGLGRNEEALRAGMRGVEMRSVEKEAWRGSFRLIDLAKIYAMTGDQEKAIDTLERLLSIPSEVSGVLLKIDPSWNSLRSNKRFQKLVTG
jgi:tetratricopeptide (TPR) repeat protein